MKLKSELAIKAAIEAQAPAAWSRKNFEALLKQHREAWGAPQSLTTSGLIEFLIDNEIVRPVEIRSKAYDRKMRYVLGRPSPLQFALSFFKDSYLSHASALEVHGLGSSEMTYVNREQSPKKTTSRLSQGRIDMAFENQPRRSAFEFVSGSFRVTFLNGKHTGDAGVIEMPSPSAERVRVTSLERTFIDCVVRPQYAGGIVKIAAAYRDGAHRVSIPDMVLLLKKTKYIYPYHQAIGFLLQMAGRTEEDLKPLLSLGLRFKFYLDYGMEAPAFVPQWKLYYPAGLASTTL
jgi:hypothetical protein